MLWQVYRRKGVAFVSQLMTCIVAAVLSGLMLTYAWSASPRLAFALAILLFGAGLFQLTRWKTSLGRAASIGVLFGLLVSSTTALYGIVVRSFPVLSELLSYGPEDFTDAQAKNYFDQQQQTLVALVHLISQCEGLGTTSIYPDGHVFATVSDAVKCPSTQEISALLKFANILWVLASGNRPTADKVLSLLCSSCPLVALWATEAVVRSIIFRRWKRIHSAIQFRSKARRVIGSIAGCNSNDALTYPIGRVKESAQCTQNQAKKAPPPLRTRRIGATFPTSGCPMRR
jgi:hypothetical protein